MSLALQLTFQLRRSSIISSGHHDSDKSASQYCINNNQREGAAVRYDYWKDECQLPAFDTTRMVPIVSNIIVNAKAHAAKTSPPWLRE